MFKIEKDNIFLTRGDAMTLTISALNKDGTNYEFQEGEKIRIKIFEKGNVENVFLSKDFTVQNISTKVDIKLTSSDTKIGELINEPTEYWYEIELKPDEDDTNTIIGYSKERGPAIFTLLPEGGEKSE